MGDVERIQLSWSPMVKQSTLGCHQSPVSELCDDSGWNEVHNKSVLCSTIGGQSVVFFFVKVVQIFSDFCADISFISWFERSFGVNSWRVNVICQPLVAICSHRFCEPVESRESTWKFHPVGCQAFLQPGILTE